jgi:thioredoxin-like negative regulator of GroEL
MEDLMKRLSSETFGSFISEAATAAVMFGSPTGDATMDQAIEFVDAWERRRDVGFGYVDAFEQIALARSFSIRVLPTTLVLRQGEIVARYEGRHSLSTLC